jgi:hypothetical protein
MDIPAVLAAFKTTLEPLGVHLYDYVPDSPNTPCVIIYAERVPYAVTQGATFVLWCLSGQVETAGAQARMMSWLSDDTDDSIVSLLDADHTLGGTVSSVLPVEVRRWGAAPTQEGRPRLLQAEIVCEVLRKLP